MEHFVNLEQIDSTEQVELLFKQSLPRPHLILGYELSDSVQRLWKASPPIAPVVYPDDPPPVYFDPSSSTRHSVASLMALQVEMRGWLDGIVSDGLLDDALIDQMEDLAKDEGEIEAGAEYFFTGYRAGLVSKVRVKSVRAACFFALNQILEHDLIDKVRYCALEECKRFVLDISGRGRRARKWCSDDHGSKARQRKKRIANKKSRALSDR